MLRSSLIYGVIMTIGLRTIVQVSLYGLILFIDIPIFENG